MDTQRCCFMFARPACQAKLTKTSPRDRPRRSDLRAAALSIRRVGHFTEAFGHLVDGLTPRNVRGPAMPVLFRD